MKSLLNKNEIKESVLILPDIRSAINVGAIFRTADAVGINKIYLVGVTPRPTDQFGRIQKDIAKSALGAETWIKWEYEKDIQIILKKLKKEKFNIVALEQDEKSIDYREIKNHPKMAFILGQEVDGVDKKVLRKCDQIAEIPMFGKKESLNVSVACGVFLFRIFQ
jgi:tRNA G18 (ribose-2'-O)-methylase SpoU